MHSFKAGKHTFDLQLTIGRCKKIAARYHIDFLEGNPETIIELLMIKPLTRMGILYEIVVWPDPAEPMDQDAFDDVLTGDALKQAQEALWNEVDFFTRSVSPERADLIQKMIAKAKAITQKQIELVEELTTGPNAEAAINKALDQVRSEALKQIDNMPTALRERLESIPTRTPSEN